MPDYHTMYLLKVLERTQQYTPKRTPFDNRTYHRKRKWLVIFHNAINDIIGYLLILCTLLLIPLQLDYVIRIPWTAVLAPSLGSMYMMIVRLMLLVPDSNLKILWRNAPPERTTRAGVAFLIAHSLRYSTFSRSLAVITWIMGLLFLVLLGLKLDFVREMSWTLFVFLPIHLNLVMVAMIYRMSFYRFRKQWMIFLALLLLYGFLLLLSLKLDGILVSTTMWSISVPLWMIYSLLGVFAIAFCCLVNLHRSRAWWILPLLFLVEFITLGSMIVFQVLLCLKNDNSYSFSYNVMFSPLYTFMACGYPLFLLGWMCITTLSGSR